MFEQVITELLSKPTTFQAGDVALVGAGPGDVDLLTIKALKLMQQADIVIYDRLVSPEILALIPYDTQKLYVGKAQSHHCVPQDKINALLVEKAQQGLRVLRLKGGDPFVFGRGGEEMQALLAHNIACHVCPGITAATACTTYAAIPLTFRGIAQQCSFITGHLQHNGELNLAWQQLAESKHTLVFYMALTTLPQITQSLIAHGAKSSTPAAIISHGTRENQQTYRGTLSNIASLVTEHNITSPALIVIGDVVNVFANVDILGQAKFLQHNANNKTTVHQSTEVSVC
jgi:uroporphyrin-III C-methyltransferase